MKLLKKTLVAAGVATALLATGAAQAATLNNPSTAAVPTAGKAIVNESVRTVISPVATVVTLAAGEQLSIDDSITFTLSSGTFAAAVVGDLSTLSGNGTFALVSGGTGSSSAVFRVTAQPNTADTITLAATATVTGTAIADSAALNVQVDMSGFVGGAQTALFGSPLTSLNAQLVPTMTAAVVSATGIFDVASGFAALNGVTATATGATTSNAGTVTTTINAAAAVNTTTTGAPLGLPSVNKVLITVSGPMTGVAAISSTNIQASSSAGVATTGLGVVATNFTLDTANNVATGTQNNNLVATSTTITFAGTTAYDASAYTAVASMLSDVAGGYGVNASVGSGTLFAFSRNGSSFTTNSFGSLNKMTVTDRSGALGGAGADGAIAITAFDAAGAAVTCTGLTIANVPNNGTTTIQGSDVTTACVGAKRIEGIVNSTTILTTNTKLTADGATMQSGGNNSTSIMN